MSVIQVKPTGNPIIATAGSTWILREHSRTFENVMWECAADGDLVLAKDASSAEASNIQIVSGSSGQTYDVFNGVPKTFAYLYLRTLPGGTVTFHQK